MRLSIIIPVLNSHEIVRRNNLHYGRMDIPNDVEILYIDDGSDPPTDSPYVAARTNDTRPWTWALARNLGARICRGEYVFMTDLDYIILPSVIVTRVGSSRKTSPRC
jgi:glycosyltransferase involved in cell wall biosynthesis